MSKDIWHTGKEIPDEDRYIVVKNYAGLYSAGSEFEYNLDGVEKWAYFDDLLALETDLDRTRKALKLALDWLGQVATLEKCDDDLCREFTKRKLAEIKTALEQKD